MAKWFIALGLVVAFLAFLIIGSGFVTGKALDFVQQKEGDQADLSQAAIADPAGFSQKYLPYLKARYYDLRYALIMGNDQVATRIAESTLSVYQGTPLEQQPVYYQEMLFDLGQIYDDSLMPSAALADYSKFIAQYPDNPLVPKAQRRMNSMQEALH